MLTHAFCTHNNPPLTSHSYLVNSSNPKNSTLYKHFQGEHVILVYLPQVSGVLLVAPTASSLEPRRKEFSRTMKEVREKEQEWVVG